VFWQRRAPVVLLRRRRRRRLLLVQQLRCELMNGDAPVRVSGRLLGEPAATASLGD